MITGGNNIGRIGQIQSLEKHPGSFEIVHVRDASGNTFSTRLGNVMVIGDSKTAVISLPKGEGIKLSLIEERANRLGNEDEEEDDEEDDA
jgi:small subunit ribosomal protein S4e